MATSTEAPRLAVVADESQVERGIRIHDQRVALGMSKSALARRAGVDRASLDRIEDGSNGVRETTMAAVERALSEFDEEISPPPTDVDDHRVVRFVVRGVYGAEALVVEGPVESIAELEASVDRIMRRLRSGEDHPS